MPPKPTLTQAQIDAMHVFQIRCKYPSMATNHATKEECLAVWRRDEAAQAMVQLATQPVPAKEDVDAANILVAMKKSKNIMSSPVLTTDAALDTQDHNYQEPDRRVTRAQTRDRNPSSQFISHASNHDLPQQPHTPSPTKPSLKDNTPTVIRMKPTQPFNQPNRTHPVSPHTLNPSRAESALLETRIRLGLPPSPTKMPAPTTQPNTTSSAPLTHPTSPSPPGPSSAHHPSAQILHPIIRGAHGFTATHGRFYFHVAERDNHPKHPRMKMVRYEVFPRPKPFPVTQEWEGKGLLLDGSADPGYSGHYGGVEVEGRKGLPGRVVELLREVEGEEEVVRVVESARGGRRWVRKEWKGVDAGEAVREAVERRRERVVRERVKREEQGEEGNVDVKMEDAAEAGGEDVEMLSGVEEGMEGDQRRDSVLGAELAGSGRKSLLVKFKLSPGQLADLEVSD
ncbi:hypothetical protein BDZ85DRAFT_314905 [Elsinoe ampelina]|uniref:Uncharacterized protein n=1 Tax=Elsinoe ampelina TaxID=302913 RepID=A0A6A6GNI0_9PEZI|nr:hypothetical protein BDZ85DRAFT_314905 [Elsinoe ampelina]